MHVLACRKRGLKLVRGRAVGTGPNERINKSYKELGITAYIQFNSIQFNSMIKVHHARRH